MEKITIIKNTFKEKISIKITTKETDSQHREDCLSNRASQEALPVFILQTEEGQEEEFSPIPGLSMNTPGTSTTSMYS